MSNSIIWINKRFVVKNSDVSCLALIFNLSNPRMTSLHAKNRFKVARKVPFFLRRIGSNSSLSSKGESQTRSESVDRCSIVCSPSAILQGTESVSALTRALLYCRALYEFFLDFISGELALTIWLPLFWSTWSRARDPDSATCVGLARGRDYSYCIASEQHESAWKGLAIVFPWIVENTWKTVAHTEGF